MEVTTMGKNSDSVAWSAFFGDSGGGSRGKRSRGMLTGSDRKSTARHGKPGKPDAKVKGGKAKAKAKSSWW
jgi:hypothetical protein